MHFLVFSSYSLVFIYYLVVNDARISDFTWIRYYILGLSHVNLMVVGLSYCRMLAIVAAIGM